jgi:hypothetical protein
MTKLPRLRLNQQIRAEVLRWADGSFYAPEEEREALEAHAALQARVDGVIATWAAPAELEVLRRFDAAVRVRGVLFRAPNEAASTSDDDRTLLLFGTGDLLHTTNWRTNTRGHRIPTEGVRSVDFVGMRTPATRLAPARNVDKDARGRVDYVCVPELRGSPEVAAWAFAKAAWLDKLAEQRRELREALSRLTMADDALQLHPGIPERLLKPSASALVPLAASVNLAALAAVPVRS